MQAPVRPSGEREPTPGALPSPPLTRASSLASADGDGDVPVSYLAVPRPAPAHTPEPADRASAPFLDLSTPLPSPGDEAGPSAPRRSIPAWEAVAPPADNNAGTFSSSDTRAFHTLRAPPSARPLVPKSSYYFGPPPPGAAFGTAPAGALGAHHPREVLRLERDYSGGELVQFSSAFPLELEGRITPTQFLESVNALNEILISAHSLAHAALDNVLQIFSLQLSRLVLTTHYDKQMRRLRRTIDSLNSELFNPAGLNILWPHAVAFLFLEIEYY